MDLDQHIEALDRDGRLLADAVSSAGNSARASPPTPS
jgi:hypothetical protein